MPSTLSNVVGATLDTALGAVLDAFVCFFCRFLSFSSSSRLAFLGVSKFWSLAWDDELASAHKRARHFSWCVFFVHDRFSWSGLLTTPATAGPHDTMHATEGALSPSLWEARLGSSFTPIEQRGCGATKNISQLCDCDRPPWGVAPWRICSAPAYPYRRA